MPMKNSSTFIFFVKNFLVSSELNSKNVKEVTGNDLTEKGPAEAAPSAWSIQKILNFARSYDVVETKSTGQVEMNYN